MVALFLCRIRWRAGVRFSDSLALAPRSGDNHWSSGSSARTSNIRLNDVRIGQDLVCRSSREFLAVVQHENLIREVAVKLHVMLDPHDGRSELVTHSQQITREVFLLLTVQP